MVFVNASSAKSEAISPLITCGEPPDILAPFKTRLVTLYVVAADPDVLELKFSPTALSEQTKLVI